MSNIKNSAMWGSFAHRLGTVMRTRQAADYIGLFEGSGGFEPYVQENSYDKDAIVSMPNGMIAISNDVIPPGTGVVFGTTGATFRKPVSLDNFIMVDEDTDEIYIPFAKNGTLNVKKV